MSTIERKKRIVKKIEDINDEELLLVLEHLMELRDKDEIMQLSSAQKEALLAAEKDIEAGNLLSDAEAKRQIDEWLSK